MAMPADDAVIRGARPIRKGYQLIQELVSDQVSASIQSAHHLIARKDWTVLQCTAMIPSVGHPETAAENVGRQYLPLPGSTTKPATRNGDKHAPAIAPDGQGAAALKAAPSSSRRQ
ncbi:hypothetical protein [Herbaspirillum frisingense]|nr:hypothetical protein [Herbaspirillum frisingense]UIN22007.1 hypothetical protein LAZ82_02530 [Herbaspirillum frisingense]HZG18534.1 hypothetical protein [Herbaspirillum sp.]